MCLKCIPRACNILYCLIFAQNSTEISIHCMTCNQLANMLLYLNILMELIIEKYFNNSLCLLHYHENTDNLVQLRNIPIYSINGEQNLILDTEQICKHFLLQHDNANEALKSVEYVIGTDHNWNYNYRKYIIILNSKEEFVNFYNSNLLSFVRDVLVIVPSNYDKNETIFGLNTGSVTQFDLYTHRYIGLNNNNDPMLLDTWFSKNLSFKFGNDLFPDKITNQFGRVLRAPCFEHIPYTVCTGGEILSLLN